MNQMCFWEYLLFEYPNGFSSKNWIDKRLSKVVCFDCIKKHIGRKWSSRVISSRKDLPFDLIIKTCEGDFMLNFGIMLDKNKLFENKNLPWDFIKMYRYDLCENSWQLSKNPNVSNKDFKDHNKNFLINKFLPLGYIENNLDFFCQSDADMRLLVKNRNITPEFLLKYCNGINGIKWRPPYTSTKSPCPDKLLFMLVICQNKNLTLDFIEKNLNGINGVPWCLNTLSSNPIITWDFIMKYPNGINGKNWNMRRLCTNPNLCFEFVENNPDGLFGKKWDPYNFNYNNGLPLEFIEKYVEGFYGHKWQCHLLSVNKNLTWDFVLKYPNGILDSSWSITGLSSQKWLRDMDRKRFFRVKPA